MPPAYDGEVQVESEDAAVSASLHRIAGLIRGTGGFVADGFIAREQEGQFSCAITAELRSPGTTLVSYDPQCTVPMAGISWRDDPRVLEPSWVPPELDHTQRQLLDEWLVLVNQTHKLNRVRSSLPRFTVTDWPLRHHLANGGYPTMRNKPELNELRRIAINWHCRSDRSAQTTSPRTRESNESDVDGANAGMSLIPLKHLVNHHPQGAHQAAIAGQVSVVAGPIPGTDETFENYGELDAMQLLLGFGFVADFAPMVHSVPVSVDSVIGPIVLEWLPPRGNAPPSTQDVPIFRPSLEGLKIHALSVRETNRERVRDLLAMALQARGVRSAEIARSKAEKVLDDVVAANLTYYSQLDGLVISQLQRLSRPDNDRSGRSTLIGDLPELPASAEEDTLRSLAEVSLTQQQRLRAWWGGSPAGT